MHTLVIASQKGGSGKTTLSGHLAVEAEGAGAGPVALIDTDPQGSLAEWWNARDAESPAFVKVHSLDIEQTLANLENSGFRLVIVDTPPAIVGEISNVVACADLVLVPTRPSPHDLRAIGATVEIIEQANKPLIFVVNDATAKARITGDTAVALSQHGTVAPVMLHSRVDYAASMVDGRTVGEVTPQSKSAEEIKALWKYVADRLQRTRQEPKIAGSSQQQIAEISSPPAGEMINGGAQHFLAETVLPETVPVTAGTPESVSLEPVSCAPFEVAAVPVAEVFNGNGHPVSLQPISVSDEIATPATAQALSETGQDILRLVAPKNLTPELVTPESVAPESVAPEPIAPESVKPGFDAHESIMPEPVMPEPVMPEPVVSEPVVSEPIVPKSSAPEFVKPESVSTQSLSLESISTGPNLFLPLTADMEIATAPTEENPYSGPERRKGDDRRAAKVFQASFGGADRRVAHPFGRRRSDRIV